MSENESRAERDRDGRYADRLARVCVCGHTKGVHTAERAIVDGKPCQPCVDADEPCDCETYKRARKGTR